VSLTTQLRREHGQIVQVLEKIKTAGVGSPVGQRLLLSAKQGLLAHLAKEDEKLYPALNRAAQDDPSLRNTLEIFAKDMDTVSQAALDFFGKYEGGGSGLEFARDFGQLFAALGARIGREENILYKRYDALQ